MTDKLTVDEFFEKLEGLGLEWQLHGGMIRGPSYCCPITALAPDGPTHALESGWVAIRLGLKSSVYMMLVNVADNRVSTCTERRYRKRLLKACGLA